jgi:1-pyrroline-5-carboxylate dehydrogenase
MSPIAPEKSKALQLPPYQNEPYSDFTKAENTKAYQEAIKRVRSKLANEEYPLIIGKERITTEKQIISINPSRPGEVVGRVSSANPEHAEKALEVAWQAFQSWSRTPVNERVEIIFRAAKLLRERKYDFSALMTLEVAKNYAEAEGDTAEAIDFLEYYARSALKYNEPIPLVQLPGEVNKAMYIPLGVGVSISPWNFPLAIFLGMAVGPIVAGNTMIVKPAGDSPVIAAWAVNLLLEAGLPEGVINFLPGPGASTGDYLVSHPKTRFINFTGSKPVGLDLNVKAAKVHIGQKWIKRVTLELGGKDALIVDETSDLDKAADAAVASAFGFSGQKCSALSRLIAVDEIYNNFLARVVERANKLTLDNAEDNPNMSAVVSQKQYDTMKSYLALAPKEGKVVLGGKSLDRAKGFFVEATIVSEVSSKSLLAKEEIFGPILSVIRAKDFEHALQIANDSEFGLTGGLFSNDEARLERATRDFHVGNLYLNRKITGAMVGAHPFGGFNMSGTDSKAGGPDYLGLFLQMKSVAKRIN